METAPQFIQLNDSVRMSPTITKFAAAMTLVQAEMGSAPENAKNPHFNSSYADLSSVINTAKPVLAKHGFSMLQFPSGMPPNARVTTVVLHSSGEWMAGDLTLRPSKDDPQGHGSAISYARRYSGESVLNMATKDDDGNNASQSGNQPRQDAPPYTGAPGDYVIPFGNDTGKKLSQVSAASLQKSVNYWVDRARKEGKQLTGKPAEFCQMVDDYLSSNARQPQDGPPPGMFDDVPF